MRTVSVTTHSLSALTPIKFTYKFNKEERLTNNKYAFYNGFSYYTHSALSAAQDVLMSKKNLLILTDNISLRDIFHSDSDQVNIGKIAGSFYLKSPSNAYVTKIKNDVFMGGVGEKLGVTVVPITNNLVELVVDKTRKLTVDENYPYTVKISDDQFSDGKLLRQRFEMDYFDGRVSFKIQTKEGPRFMSFGADKVIRAVGLELNETVVNPCRFYVEMISDNGIYYNFDAKTSEVKYFNELGSFNNQNNVVIKEDQESNTHLLISCATSLLGVSAEVPVNIALTKSNFSSSGSYSTKQTIS